MRATFAIFATIALAACGSETTVDDPSDPAQVAAAAESLPDPMPGEYSVTGELVDFEIPGASEEEAGFVRSMMEAGFAQSNSFCLTEEEAAGGFERFVEEMQNSPDGCQMSEFRTASSSFNATMTCDEGGNTGTVGIEADVTPTTQDMTMTMDMTNPDMPGGAVKMTIRMQSERTGECSA